MLRDLISSRRNPQTRIGFGCPRVLCLAIVLAITMAGPGAASAVHAAPPPDDLPFTLEIIMPRGLLCANHDYSVLVTPWGKGTVEKRAEDGTKYFAVDKIRPVVAIEAFSQNASVATIAPKRQWSGFDVDAGDLSASVFTLHTGKAGTARVYFQAGYLGAYAGPGVDVQVVNCMYEITIKVRATGSGSNIFLTHVYTATGQIGGDPSGTLTGEAKVTWNMKQAGDCYTATTTASASGAQLNGTLTGEGDTLTVKLNPSALTANNAVRMAGLCARSGASASKQVPVQPPPLVFTVPGAGGSDSLPYTYTEGEVTVAGTAIMRAVPIASQ